MCDIFYYRREAQTLRAELHAMRMLLAKAYRDRAPFDAGGCHECKVCMDAPVEVVFLPCGHALACQRCAATNECPVCRCRIEGRTRIYFT